MTKKYALDLEDAHAGWVTAPDGYFDVVPWLGERRGAVLLEPAGAFWGWLQGSQEEPREAAIVAFDAEGGEVERLVLRDPWISELGMPALDAGRGGAIWLQIEAKSAELRAGASTTASAREGGAVIAGCLLYLHGAEAPPLQVETIAALRLVGDRGHSLQRLAMTVSGAVEVEATEALVGSRGVLEYVDSAGKALTRVEFRVAGADAQKVEGAEATRTRLALACRGLQPAG